MYHPETMHQLVKERQERYQREAREDRLVREATSVLRQEPRERFRVRDLRWVLFRPAGA
jgi:hypothetical protein